MKAMRANGHLMFEGDITEVAVNPTGGVEIIALTKNKTVYSVTLNVEDLELINEELEKPRKTFNVFFKKEALVTVTASDAQEAMDIVNEWDDEKIFDENHSSSVFEYDMMEEVETE
jgi:hypothetical protein